MALLIDNTQDIIDAKDVEGLVSEVVNKTFEALKVDYNCQISVTLADNEQIRQLNKNYRNIDAPTDVLSFPMIDYDDGKHLDDLGEEEIRKTDSIDIDTQELVLGDIIISLEKAYEQSEEYGHSPEREIAFLATHGILHLMGYDHEEENERAVMRQREEEILNMLDKKR